MDPGIIEGPLPSRYFIEATDGCWPTFAVGGATSAVDPKEPVTNGGFTASES
jgi:hypothetical protein